MIESVLKNLTINEKIKLLSGGGQFITKSIDDKEIPSVIMYDGPHGVRNIGTGASLNLGKESKTAICYPTLSALANSWNEELLYESGKHIGIEASADSINIILGPGVNIKRNPLCGRNFEYFSEDPLLAGKLGAAWTNGLQSTGTGASLKHYCCNNQETDRMTSNSIVDERTLREIYLKPFEIVVKDANPSTVMCSYNRLNGEYLSDSKRLLTNILVDEWGFEGFTISDWTAVNNRVAGIKAGLALEMPVSLGYFDKSIEKALETCKLTEDELNKCLEPMLKKILEIKNNTNDTEVVSYDKYHQFCRKAAAECAVLLKNDGTLPYNGNSEICVIGELAKNPRYQGSGSSRVNPYKVDSLLDGLDGYGLMYDYFPGFLLNGSNSQEVFDEAIEASKKHKNILLALGLSECDESEGFDRSNMRLPDEQNKLVEELIKLGKNIVVILYSGSCVELPWADNVNSILYMGLSGEATGTACADILFGKINPSGKLAESWPLTYDDHITSDIWLEDRMQSYYKEGIFVGYRYFDSAKIKVRYPFGFGLSYTKFEYKDIKIERNENNFEVSFFITNIGKVKGQEITQLYISAINGNVIKPLQELRRFSKSELNPGETKIVKYSLSSEAFEHYDIKTRKQFVENGKYEIRVGSGSRDIRIGKTITIDFGVSVEKQEMGWYSHLKGTPTLNDLSLLYAKEFHLIQPYNKGTYDWNASLSELAKDSRLIKVMCKFVEFGIAKQMKIKVDYTNPEFKMLAISALSQPIRSLALFSPKIMSKFLVKLLLKLANGF